MSEDSEIPQGHTELGEIKRSSQVEIQAPLEIRSHLSREVKESFRRPGTRYKVPLADLVSKIVASNPQEDERLKSAVKEDFELEEMLFDTKRSEDWEKALHDEANFQFSSKYRPIVEAVLNGIDTQLRKEAKSGVQNPNKRVDVQIHQNGFIVRDQGEGMDSDTLLTRLLVPKLTGNTTATTDVVGRFGVGFYSLLGYLKGEKDLVIVRTSDGREGYRLSIGKFPQEQDSSEKRLSVVISPLGKLEQQRIGQGTEVEIRSSTFEAEGAQKYLEETLQYKPEAEIAVNGVVINTMSALQTTEVDLPRNYGEKRRKTRILESHGESTEGKVVLAVGGVKVEEFTVKGAAVPKTFVLDIPPGDNLPKSRDRVEVNPETIQAIEHTIHVILEGSIEDSAKRISALAPAVLRLQGRNPFAQRDKNMDLMLRDALKNWKEKLPKGRFFVPNSPELAKVALPGAIPIDRRFTSGKIEIPGVKADTLFDSGGALFWVPFKNPDDVLAIVPGAVFVNEKFRTSDPRTLGVFNALISTINDGAEKDEAKIKGKFAVGGSSSKREAHAGVMIPTGISDSSLESREESDKTLAGFVQSLKPKIQGRPVVEEIHQRKGFAGFIDRVLPRAKKLLPKERDFTPTSVEELQDWLIKSVTSVELEGSLFADEDYPYSLIKVSDDPTFWRSVINDEYFDWMRGLISGDDSAVTDKVLAVLPHSIKQEILALHAYNMDLNRGIPEHQSLIWYMIQHLHNFVTSSEEKRSLSRAIIGLRTITHLQPFAKLFDDTEFLSKFTREGKYAEIFNNIITTNYIDRGNSTTHSQKIDNFFNAGNVNMRYIDDGINFHLFPLADLENTQEKNKYMDWLLANNKQLFSLLNSNQDIILNLSFVSSYRALYTMTVDHPETWNILFTNLDIIRSQQGNILGEKNLPHFSIEYLGAGVIDRSNISTILAKLKSGNFIDEEERYSYMKQAFGYAHLPHEIFEQLNTLLFRMHTERDSVIEDLYTEHYNLQSNPDRKEAYERYFKDDGFAYNEHFIHAGMVPDLGTYRLLLDDPELIRQRVTVLENLPAEYAIFYHKLQTLLVDPKPSIAPSHYRETHKEVALRLRTVFQKLVDMPQNEAIEILIKITDELKPGIDRLRERITRYEKIDRDARPWLTYFIGKSEALPRREKANFMEGIDDSVDILGSELVSKYFTSDELGTVKDFGRFRAITSAPVDSERAKEVGQRRIEHAVNYQSTQGYAWLRELVQNAYNATRSDNEQKVVHIENYLEGSDFAISVNDPVGMSINTVINALLVPQKSDWESKEVLGYFGHGFFTVFKEADEVRVKTSTGDGQVTYLNLRPLRQQGKKVTDLQISIGVKNEAYKGTSVQWVKKTDFQDFEAARARTELTTYAGLLPSEALAIQWNNEQINRNPRELVRVLSPLGEIKLYQIAGENTVTKDGLYLKELDEDYTGVMPYGMKDILLGHGISLDIPGGIRLIDSRADIAKKEEVLPQLRSAIAEASVKAATQLFIDGKVEFHHLPFDFFDRVTQYIVDIDQKIFEDVNLLIENNPIGWNPYIQNPNKALQLILSIPCLEIEGKKYSIVSAVALASTNPDFKAKLPFFISEKVKLQPTPEQEKEEMNIFEGQGYKKLAEFSSDSLPKELDTYQAWDALFRKLLDSSVQATGKTFQSGFYSDPEKSIARCHPWVPMIGWNLYHISNNVEMLGKVLRRAKIAPQVLIEVYKFISETGSHEYQHVIENTSESWTHNPTFHRGQRKWLEQMLRSADIEMIENELKALYTGGYQPPAVLSQRQARNV